MNRKAVWAVLLLPAPAAEVGLYGNIRSGVEVSQTKTAGMRHSRTSVSGFGSYAGLRGSHPIGGSGANAVWKFEQDAPAGRSSGSMREYFRNKKENGAVRWND